MIVKNIAKQAKDHYLLNFDTLPFILSAYKAAVPMIKLPKKTSSGTYLIGRNTELTKSQVDSGFYCINSAGISAKHTDKAFSKMLTTVTELMAAAKDQDQLRNMLIKTNITTTIDAPSYIFEDSKGNKAVCFINGLGPIGAAMLTICELHTGYERIKGKIRATLTENQATALASLVASIGTESFLNSNIALAVNSDIMAVPEQLMKWCGNPDGTINDMLLGQRRFEANLFLTSDKTTLEFNFSDATSGSLTFTQLADTLRIKRS